MRRAAAVAVIVMLALAPPASAAPILEPADAAELAQTLADAQADQGVCYGWNVSGDADSAGSSTLGPGRPLQPDPAACPRGTVELVGDVIYECESCDDGDRAEVAIRSSLERPPTPSELVALGLSADGLAGDADDEALFDMVSALPLLVAEHGQAPFVEYETATGGDVPARDRPTDSPGSDTLRAVAAPAGVGLFLVLCGVGYFFYKRGQTTT